MDCKINTAPVVADIDGMARVGWGAHALRGIRLAEGDGAAPGVTFTAPPAGGKPAERVEGEGDLGDAGKAALDRVRQERNTARAEAKAFKDLGLSVDDIRALKDAADKANQPDEERIRAQAVKDADRQAHDRYAVKLRAAEVRAQAAALGFAAPGDAIALLDQAKLSAVDVSEADEVDAAEVGKLLEALKAEKPYLLKPTDHTADHRTAGIGSTGSGSKPEVRPGVDRVRAAYATADANR